MATDDSLPTGFTAYVGAAGLRGDGDDVAIVVAAAATTSAALFTKSLFAGPSVELSRRRAAGGMARALVVVAKNANVATGDAGRADAAELTSLVAVATGLDPEEVLVASTGVIGRPLPMGLLRSHLAALPWPGGFCADARDVARAIMTTDTIAKVAVRRAGAARIVGVAKGVGMIEPDMATMLAFVFTDAALEEERLGILWRRAVDDSFNCLSVDTDTSTSDTAVVMASGAAGPVAEAELAMALREVCLDLTLQIARDGEGATKLITVTVCGARDDRQAKRVAKAIVNSPLVKTAVHGGDPNWGRVAMAIGKCSDETDIAADRVRICFGEQETYPAIPGPDDLEALRVIMSSDHVEIEVDLGVETDGGRGHGEATVFGCDLSEGYIRINADYTT